MKSLKFEKLIVLFVLFVTCFVLSSCTTHIVYEKQEKTIEETQRTTQEIIDNVYEKLEKLEEINSELAAQQHKIHIVKQGKFPVFKTVQSQNIIEETTKNDLIVEQQSQQKELLQQNDTSNQHERIETFEERLEKELEIESKSFQTMLNTHKIRQAQKETKDAKESVSKVFWRKKKKEPLAKTSKNDENSKEEVSQQAKLRSIDITKIEDKVEDDQQTSMVDSIIEVKSEIEKHTEFYVLNIGQTFSEVEKQTKIEFDFAQQLIEKQQVEEPKQTKEEKVHVVDTPKKQLAVKNAEQTKKNSQKNLEAEQKDSSILKSAENKKLKQAKTFQNDQKKISYTQHSEEVSSISVENSIEAAKNEKAKNSKTLDKEENSLEQTSQQLISAETFVDERSLNELDQQSDKLTKKEATFKTQHSANSVQEIAESSLSTIDEPQNNVVHEIAQSQQKPKKVQKKISQKVFCEECLQKFDVLVEHIEDDLYSWKLNSISNMLMVKDWIRYVSQKTATKVGNKWLIGKFDDQLLKESALALSDVLKIYEQIGVTVYLNNHKSVNFLSKNIIEFKFKDVVEYSVRLECSQTCHMIVLNNSYMSVYSNDLEYDVVYDVNDLFAIKIRKLK